MDKILHIIIHCTVLLFSYWVQVSSASALVFTRNFHMHATNNTIKMTFTESTIPLLHYKQARHYKHVDQKKEKSCRKSLQKLHMFL